MVSHPLEGKTTLITGASVGIGRATAQVFAKKGSNLVLLARSERKLEEFCSELERNWKIQARALSCDVSDVDDLREKLLSFLKHDPIDIAIINAGIGHYGPFVKSQWDDLDTVIRTNISGALATAYAVLPPMIERKSGSVVFVSSVIGKRAVQWNSVYCASKFALHGFADALRLEVKDRGVHVGVVCPARTRTEFFDRMIYSVPQPKQRPVPVNPPEKVAKAIFKTVLLKKRETIISLGGKLYAYFGYHFPRISDFILSFAVPKPKIL